MSEVCRPARLAVGLIVDREAGRPTCRSAPWRGPMVPFVVSGRLALGRATFVEDDAADKGAMTERDWPCSRSIGSCAATGNAQSWTGASGAQLTVQAKRVARLTSRTALIAGT